MKTIKKRTWLATLSTAIVITGLSFIGLGNAAAADFSYNGDTGPGYWYELNPEWSACAGRAADARQSPIDIERVRIDPDLKPLALQTFPTTIDIFNNGHSIQQQYENTGSTITFEGRTYELQQFHFHTLSEHAVDGERGAMELHAVFQEAASGDNLVVGMLYEAGKKNNSFFRP